MAIVIALRASKLDQEDSEAWLRKLLRRASRNASAKVDCEDDECHKQCRQLFESRCSGTQDLTLPTFERLRVLSDRMLGDYDGIRLGGFRRIAKVQNAKGWDVVVCEPGKSEYKRDAPHESFSLIRIHLEGDGGLQKLRSCDLEWSRRVLWILNLRVGLKSANAYISTLGGGYFLCRQLDQAEGMALRQLAVAYYLGDPILASQCRIHLAYNIMQRGRLDLARWWILREWRNANALQNELLKSMLASAWHYRRQLLRHQHILSQAPQDRVRDSYARQRFVQ